MTWLKYGIAKGVGTSGHLGGIQSSPGYARSARARCGIKRSEGGVVDLNKKEETMSNQQQRPRCPRCEGRLFRESEFRGNHLLYFWECSLGCSRQFSQDGKLMSRMAGERRVRVVRELVLVS